MSYFALGILGSNPVHLGLIPEILKILRNVEPKSEHEPRLKPAGVCALSSLCLHDMGTTLFCYIIINIMIILY